MLNAGDNILIGKQLQQLLIYNTSINKLKNGQVFRDAGKHGS